ncbi:hydantoinase B/oxoprolinase family protein [Sulfuracidifex metallicus]|uniref:5-oxoprolinase n=1 Tax=Sulfuracidifex metallicus DSM 6482 = JCM 9184 TaxID=523847 RepID=A0A6A9QLE4_SULME|nr:5-oxoprolinase [Sulfuracidifex metallicus DSM 6482 = JCM 9184]WOE51797.1 hydantoinase B/oxoprolinase family protein [Sulfuracidifex metallicus DSM 6482 = JCM 9184]
MNWEIINKATIFIAEEMGVSLKKSALSPNIRERMDHSCAIVDVNGRIVAQAEHIPVHLGSFRVGIKNVLSLLEDVKEGDAFLFNDPYISGTHLNDVGVLTPIFIRDKLLGYAVNKAHHVDVGGPVPGSINPSATTLFEEGLVIPVVKLMRKGEMVKDVVNMIKENFKVPEFSLGDLNAQIASNRIGVQRVAQLVDKFGMEETLQGWDETISRTESLVRSKMKDWPRGNYEAEDFLEWGDEMLRIKVRLEIGDKVKADFTGTHPQIEGPLNAVLGVTYSSTSFAIRSMLEDVPTNEGFYSNVEVVTEEGTLLNPRKPAAVGGGNVETSQRVADVVFLALSKALPDRVPAASHGTMMNVMMGGVINGKYWSYYETVGGGAGARPNGDGPSAVHVNMSNTLNTPIEIAERQFPITFTTYKIREGSGGEGKFRGGDGIVRGFKVKYPTKVSILADRCIMGPWGLMGGERGKPCRVTVNGKEMPGKITLSLKAGDELVVETPGGGGYGKKTQE